MNWEALGTAAELVGAFGVIASLIFLAIETRRNTKTMRSSLSNNSLESIAALNDIVLTDPELRRVVSKSTSANMEATDFDDEEWEAVIYLGRALFLRLEGAYILYKQGLIEQDVWEIKKAVGSGMIKLPIWRRYWKQEQSNGLFSPSFIEELNRESTAEFVTPIRETAT